MRLPHEFPPGKTVRFETETFWFWDWRNILLCLLKTCNVQPNLIDLNWNQWSSKMSYCFYFLLKSTQTCKEYVSQEPWKLDKWPHFFIYFFELHPSVALIYIWKYSKLTSAWFLLIWKVPEFCKRPTDSVSSSHFSKK